MKRMDGYYPATYGYDFETNARGLFKCGCSNEHVYSDKSMVIIMWDGPEQNLHYRPWYLKCAFDALLWRLKLE
jgi:hypothetical protein